VREIFAACNQVGDLTRGLLDGWCIMVSIALQHGVPLGVITSKFRYGKFGPSGFTKQEDIARASSILDFASQWLIKLQSKTVTEAAIALEGPQLPRD
jgi:hypothetical protein